ncbi:MAG: response regulator [Desulforegulaceae bacterium]|nr:response regulator [Desulforegulaceae bacterium]
MFSEMFLIAFGFFLIIYAFIFVFCRMNKASLDLKRYRDILDEVEDGYYEVDLEGKGTLITKPIEKIFGYSADEVIGTNYSFTMTPEGAKHLFDKYNEVFLTGVPQKGVSYEAFNKNGDLIYLETSVSLIKDNKGKITGFRGITRDISSRKKTEKALKYAKDQAEAASESKSRFLANMSHEIRTPMGGIVGMANLLKETELNDEQKKQVEVILKSSNTLVGIINDILDFSKIESGQLILRTEPVDLRSLIENIKETLMASIKEKSLYFEIDIDTAIPEIIISDELRLQQILFNIIGNAVKFTQKGGIVVLVRLSAKGKNKNINFKISDTGIGISEENIEKIFESFSQADNSISRKFGGTGLGLTITRELINLSGGFLKVESLEGKGSEFSFQLPFIEFNKNYSRQMNTKINTKVLKKDGLSFIRHWKKQNNNKIRVLIAEDNEVNLELAIRFLEKIDPEIKVAQNGAEAFELVQKNQFDIILMDVQMPVINGVEATRLIRDFERENSIRAVPIIAITAHGMAEDKSRCLEAGMSDYISKPFNAKDLIDSIAGCLEQSNLD